MKKRFTRAEQRQRTREELIVAAERLFTGRGFHASSVDEIALEAGYTKGAVYSNFESKEDLFFAVYERRVDRVVAD
jgi:AcrR family transcriptional regulator